MLFVQSLRKGLLALLAAGALSACGPNESQNGSAVFTDSLTISPSSISVAVPADPLMDPNPCVNNPQSLITMPVVIIVRNEQGVPLGNVDIDIFLDLAPGTVFGAGVPVTTLIDGGVQVGVPYSTNTDDDGSKTVSIGFTIANGCAYAGSLTVTSATLFQQTAFDVTTQ